MDNLTSKEIFEKVIEMSKGLCKVCYSPGTELHHIIYGSGSRRQCERLESVILLCYECHRGTNGVHGKNGRKLDLQLKKELQRTYESIGLEGEELQYWMGGRFYL